MPAGQADLRIRGSGWGLCCSGVYLSPWFKLWHVLVPGAIEPISGLSEKLINKV